MSSEINRRSPEIFSRHTLGLQHYPVVCANGIRSYTVAPHITEIVKQAGRASAPYVRSGIHGLTTLYFREYAQLLAEHMLMGGKVINVAGEDMDIPLLGALREVNKSVTPHLIPQLISFTYYPGTQIVDYTEFINARL